MLGIREIAPSESRDWAQVSEAVSAVNPGVLKVWDASADRLLGTIENPAGSTMATLVVESAGISRKSGCEIWRPTLPLVDIAPLNGQTIRP